MDLLKYLEPMKNIPERFSNLAFWRGVRKLRDEVVNAFEYVDSWGEHIENLIDSLPKNSKTLSVFDNTKNVTQNSPYLNLDFPLAYQSKVDSTHKCVTIIPTSTEFTIDYNFTTPPNENIIFCGATVLITCDNIPAYLPCMIYIKATKDVDKWVLTGRLCNNPNATFYNFDSVPTSVDVTLLIGIASNMQ